MSTISSRMYTYLTWQDYFFFFFVFDSGPGIKHVVHNNY